MIKLVIAAGVVIAAIAGTMYGVNKTAKQLEQENNAQPEADRLSQEELDSLLHPAFMEKISKSTVGIAAMMFYKNLSEYFQRWMSYRSTIAISGIILYAIPGLGIPLIAVKACWTILAIDLAIDSFTDSIGALAERRESQETLA